jgi:hypothetical protein
MCDISLAKRFLKASSLKEFRKKTIIFFPIFRFVYSMAFPWVVLGTVLCHGHLKMNAIKKKPEYVIQQSP